jgi:hypothetical protein
LSSREKAGRLEVRGIFGMATFSRSFVIAFAFCTLAVSPLAIAAEVYKCVSKDAETGYSITAEVTIKGASADLKISASGLPGCKSVPAMVVTGKKPILNLSGALACDGEEPEDVTMVLNTSRKTLSLGETVFLCK